MFLINKLVIIKAVVELIRPAFEKCKSLFKITTIVYSCDFGCFAADSSEYLLSFISDLPWNKNKHFLYLYPGA